MGDMLDALPAYTQANNTSPTQDLTPSSFNTQNTSSFYSTSSSTTSELALQKTRSPVLKHTPPRPKQYTESQLNMIPAFEIMAPRRPIPGLITEKAYGTRNHMGNKDGEIAKLTLFVIYMFHCFLIFIYISETDMKKETKTVAFAARRSVDLRRLRQQDRDYQKQSGQQTLRRVSFSHANSPTID